LIDIFVAPNYWLGGKAESEGLLVAGAEMKARTAVYCILFVLPEVLAALL